MKKIILLLVFIVSGTVINNLTAYCIYNLSPNKNDKITAFVYPPGAEGIGIALAAVSMSAAGVTPTKARYFLKPEKDVDNPKHPGCWNWKEIDKRNPNKLWVVSIVKGNKKALHIWMHATEAMFPINAAVTFHGFRKGRAIIKVWQKGKEWKR